MKEIGFHPRFWEPSSHEGHWRCQCTSLLTFSVNRGITNGILKVSVHESTHIFWEPGIHEGHLESVGIRVYSHFLGTKDSRRASWKCRYTSLLTFSGNQGVTKGILKVLAYECSVSKLSGLTQATIAQMPRENCPHTGGKRTKWC